MKSVLNILICKKFIFPFPRRLYYELEMFLKLPKEIQCVITASTILLEIFYSFKGKFWNRFDTIKVAYWSTGNEYIQNLNREPLKSTGILCRKYNFLYMFSITPIVPYTVSYRYCSNFPCSRTCSIVHPMYSLICLVSSIIVFPLLLVWLLWLGLNIIIFFCYYWVRHLMFFIN